MAERAHAARAKLGEIETERAERAKRSPKEVAAMKEPRASTTDPEAPLAPGPRPVLRLE